MVATPLFLEGEKTKDIKITRANHEIEKQNAEKPSIQTKPKSDQNPVESKKPSVNRAERRQVLHSSKFLRELLAIIYSYFPGLINQLKQVEDPRYKSYTKYDISVLLLERIFAAIFGVSSMRELTSEFSDENMIKNIATILNQNLEELPSHDTINNCFKKLSTTELERIIHDMIVSLTRRNTFNKSRLRGKYWQVLVDGTALSSFNNRHCDNCLYRRHKNKKGEVTRVEFYHYVLEAKLVLHENLVFSICTEFVENEGKIPSEEELYSPDYDEPGYERAKQDCEIKAFYRLADKLKQAFPRLPICITADSLYANQQVFEKCQVNNWRFILRFKEGSIPSLYNKFCQASTKVGHSFRIFIKKDSYTISANEDVTPIDEIYDGFIKFEYTYANDLHYEGYSINMVECKDSRVKYPFLFLTDLPIDQKNCESTVEDGRRRWRIENEAFKVQKQHGYYLKHVFCEDYNAMKVHYLAIQIAHAISQLLEHGSDVIKNLNITLKEFHKSLLKCFGVVTLTLEDLVAAQKQRKFRLSC